MPKQFGFDGFQPQPLEQRQARAQQWRASRRPSSSCSPPVVEQLRTPTINSLRACLTPVLPSPLMYIHAGAGTCANLARPAQAPSRGRYRRGSGHTLVGGSAVNARAETRGGVAATDLARRGDPLRFRRVTRWIAPKRSRLGLSRREARRSSRAWAWRCSIDSGVLRRPVPSPA